MHDGLTLSHGDAIIADDLTEAETTMVERLRRDYIRFSARRYPAARRWAERRIDALDATTTFATVEDLTLYFVRSYHLSPAQIKCPNEVLLLRDVAFDVWSICELTGCSLTTPRQAVAA